MPLGDRATSRRLLLAAAAVPLILAFGGAAYARHRAEREVKEQVAAIGGPKAGPIIAAASVAGLWLLIKISERR